MLVIFDWVMRFDSKDEVCWDELGALVEKLVERMLSICCWLSEEYWTGSVLCWGAITGNCLSVGLHGQLLEVGREAVHVLIKSVFELVKVHGQGRKILTEIPGESEHRRSSSSRH